VLEQEFFAGEDAPEKILNRGSAFVACRFGQQRKRPRPRMQRRREMQLFQWMAATSEFYCYMKLPLLF
jgi:hypothetical protein